MQTIYIYIYIYIIAHTIFLLESQPYISRQEHKFTAFKNLGINTGGNPLTQRLGK